MLTKIFGTKTFWREMLPLAIPIAIQNLLTSSFTLVDTLIVGQLGDVSLAAVGMAGQLSWLMNMVIFGICSGASIFLAQYFGEKNHDGMVKTYGLAAVSGLLLAILFFTVGFFAPRSVISIFNRNPDVLNAGVKYLKIAVFSYPAVLLNMLANIVLRSTGRVKLPMYVAVFTTFLNAFLDYGLVFGAFGLPALGIEGAAIATAISAWAGPVTIYAVSLLKKDDIFFAPVKEQLGFDKSFVGDFFRRSLPVMANETFWGLGTVVFSAIYSNMGYEYTAAVSILRTFENIAFAFFVGFTNAGCVMIGKDIGAGRIREGIETSKRFMILVPLAGAIVGAFYVVFREPLIGLFNIGGTISEKTFQSALSIMVVYGIEIAFRNVPYVSIVGVFRSGGETKKGLKYDLLCLWGISIPCTLFAAFVLKLPFVAVFLVSYLCEDYLKAFLCIRYFVSKRWIKPVTETGKKALELYVKEERTRRELIKNNV